MRVTLLASDEASAPLYRVRLLAQVLARIADVDVVGFNFAPRRGDPVAPRDFPYRELPARPWPAFAADLGRLRREVGGDLIYAMKARPTSLGAALWLGRATGKPVAVDIDDWEPYLVAPFSRHATKNLWYALPQLREPNAWPYTWATDRLSRCADGVTAVSRFFAQRYGGTWLPQLVDTRRWDPAKYPIAEARARFGLPDGLVFGFVGIAQPNKGTGDLLAALQRLERPDWTLLIAGPATPHAGELARSDPRVHVTGTLPPCEAPWAVAAADAIVLPQRLEPANAGQTPIKLVEAMALAKPIVANGLADIPELVGNAGWVVPAGASIDTLAEVLEEVLSHWDEARFRGTLARRRAAAQCSYERGADILEEFLTRAAARADRPERGYRNAPR